MIHMIIGDALCLCLKITQLCRLCDRADAIEFYLAHPTRQGSAAPGSIVPGWIELGEF